MSRAAIHFRYHTYLAVKGMYRDPVEKISGLFVEQVAKTLTTTNCAIALFASKEFLRNYLFYNKEGEKEMLKGQELEEVIDSFQYLSSPNIRIVMLLFCSNNRKGSSIA